MGLVCPLKRNVKVREQSASGEWGTEEDRSTCWKIVGMTYHSSALEKNQIKLGKFQGSSQILGAYLNSDSLTCSYVLPVNHFSFLTPNRENMI